MKECCCIVLNYNDSETVTDLVQRVEPYKNIQKIIVVDNCSSDDSYEKLKHLASEKVDVLRTDKNGGYGYGNNRGVEHAKKLGFRYAVISNPDVWFSDESVGRMLDVLCGDKVGIVSSVQYDIEGKPIKDLAWKLPNILEYIYTDTRIGKLLHFMEYRSLNEKLCEVDCVPGAMLMIDTDAFLNCGGYDEEMFLYCEETTLGFKMKENGYKTILMTEERYDHKHSVSIDKSIPSRIKQRSLIYDSKRIFLRKYLHANKFMMFLADKHFARRLRKMKESV